MSGTQLISGLSSGLDWQSIVDKLMQIEQKTVTQVETQVSTIESERSAWLNLNSQLTTLQDKAKNLIDEDIFSVFKSSISSSSSTEAKDLLSVTLGKTGGIGNFELEVLQMATTEKLSSSSFSTMDEGISLSGEFLLGGQVITLVSTDSLQDIRDQINASNTGDNPSGVTASILTTGEDSYRLILTAADSGSDGIKLQDASSNNLVQLLGFTDSGTTITNTTSSGAESSLFDTTDTAISTSLGLSSTPSSTLGISIGSYSGLSIDLSDSLTEIKDSINTQTAAKGATGDIASVVTETDDDGNTTYKLSLIGTSFTDDNNVLEALGILKGTHSDVAEIHKSSALSQTTAGGGGVITAASTFAAINTGSDANNVSNADTITISGKDGQGNTISGSFTITDTSVTTIGDLLTQIEDLYDDNGSAVTASVDANGKITVTDNATGDSQLSVSLVANNEGGGTLDLGSVTVATEGRSMQLQSGQDSIIKVDGVQLERSGNSISDAVAGVTLDIKKAEVGTTISVSMLRDNNAIQSEVQSFISSYNSVVSFIGQQTSYDEETGETGGALFANSTLGSINSRLMSTIINTIPGTASDTSSLAMLGIKLQSDGTLSMDSADFTAMLNTDIENVIDFFSLQNGSSNSNLEYIDHSRDSQAGTYDVNVTTAAEKASTTGSSNLDDVDGLDGNETLTITDDISGQVAIISLTAGMSLSDAMATINSELSRSYTEELTQSVAMNTTTASGGPASIISSTKWSELDTGGDANDITNGDVIEIELTSRSGTTVSTNFTINDKDSDTIGDLLETIENALDDKVTARINSDGKLIITDNTAGSSEISVSLNYTGAGSLDLGTQDATTTGRYAMEIEASDGGSGGLNLAHNAYGADYGFSISQTSNHLGITDQSYSGVDIVGTINGEATTGSGQTLTGDSSANNVADLVVKYTGAATGNIGNITFNLGFGETMERMLYNYTDAYEGVIETKRDGLQLSVDSLESRIESLERRLERKRETLINQYVAMEKNMNMLKTQESWFSSQMSSMG